MQDPDAQREFGKRKLQLIAWGRLAIHRAKEWDGHVAVADGGAGASTNSAAG